VKSTKPAGGGGTDPSCVPQYLNEKGIKPECVIMLTDGYVGGWGQWSVPVLWCILNNRSANPSVGIAVHIND
jgi:predicted metal-dependent peptidase